MPPLSAAAAGTIPPETLLAEVPLGIYVPEMFGSGVNLLTGDYSRGASGFMIRHGQLAEPVDEFTIFSNLLDLFARLTPASDLKFRHGTDAPTLRIVAMRIAGA